MSGLWLDLGEKKKEGVIKRQSLKTLISNKWQGLCKGAGKKTHKMQNVFAATVKHVVYVMMFV